MKVAIIYMFSIVELAKASAKALYRVPHIVVRAKI